MSRTDPPRSRLPKGVAALPKPRGGRRFRATIRRGKGELVHLGLYETAWLAAFAHAAAAELLGRNSPPLDPPPAGQPDAHRVREITARVRSRLGLDRKAQGRPEAPPPAVDVLALFEVVVIGFWRRQAAADAGGLPDAGLDAAAGRLTEAAGVLFWSQEAGHPSPLEAMTRLLARRLDQAFRRPDLTREVLDDDGDDPRRVARWLVHPDSDAGSRCKTFRDEVLQLYSEFFEGHDRVGPDPHSRRHWSEVLGLTPPFTLDRVREAYRARSREAHPDAGGTDAAFVRLRAAFDEAVAYCASRG